MTGRVVLVAGPPWSGVSSLAAALRPRLPGHTVTEFDSTESGAGAAPDAVLFVVSAVCPLLRSDLAVLDAAASRTDLVIGVVTRIDVHHGWRAVLAADAESTGAHAVRYRRMAWVGAAAAPATGEPVLTDLLAVLVPALADPESGLRNTLRRTETRLRAQIASAAAPDAVAVDLHRRREAVLRETRRAGAARSVALANRMRQARIDLGLLSRRQCAAARDSLAVEAAGWRRGRPDFVSSARDRAADVVAVLDSRVTDRVCGIAEEFDLRAPSAPEPAAAPDIGAPVLTSRRLQMQLMAVLGAGFGLGVAMAAGRLLAGLAPDAAVPTAAVSGLLGLLVMVWVVGIRGLLHDRAQLDRWVATLTATLREEVEAVIAGRLLAAETHLAAELAAHTETAARRGADRVAELDEALRARAAARAATARSADRRLSALNCALRAVRNELNRSNSGNDRF